MRNRRSGTTLLLAVLTAGCGSGELNATNDTNQDQPVVTAAADVAVNTTIANDGMISPAAIAACGNFSIDDAASLLGLPVEEMEDRSEVYSSESSLCSFSRSGSFSEGVAFYLSVSGSVERAVAEMEQGRGMAGLAQEVIDQATESESSEAATQSAQSIGEEAYFMDVNGTLMVRVGNVQVQVLPMEDREQMKLVGQMVAMGLQNT